MINWGTLYFVSLGDFLVRGVGAVLLTLVITIVWVKTIRDFKREAAIERAKRPEEFVGVNELDADIKKQQKKQNENVKAFFAELDASSAS